MNRRLLAFESLKDHAWLGRLYGRLGQADLARCLAFITEHEDASVDTFETLVNRMYLDQPDKPKNCRLIQELLSCANKI